MNNGDYKAFLSRKGLASLDYGFKPLWMPDFLFPFQSYLVEWAICKGRAALFEDCGLGKTPQSLVWAENVLRKTNKPVLILTPLAVAPQFVREGTKFGIEVYRLRDGNPVKGLNVINYQQLHKIDPSKFAGVVCDESSILKNFDGKTRRLVTDFLKSIEYRLLCTATPAPNDHMELGTSSEALGVMGRNQMLGMFFTNGGETTQQWELKGHARTRFWQWCGTWARAVRKPSDLGTQFSDEGFILPPLELQQHVLPTGMKRRGILPAQATTLDEQRKEKRETIGIRCGKVAELMPKKDQAIVWCQLNPEGDELTRNISGAVQVAGCNSDEEKEERIEAFATGQIKRLVTKPKIAAHGLNLQACHHVFYFPSHSHEQWYQAIRRCHRFGQKERVICRLVYTEAETPILSNMLRKERDSVQLYEGITRHINDAIRTNHEDSRPIRVEVPSWLK